MVARAREPGGAGTADEFARLRLGCAAAQLGTRFIATPECKASDAYKQAIVNAGEDYIVLTERLTGVPVAVIRDAYVARLGTEADRSARPISSAAPRLLNADVDAVDRSGLRRRAVVSGRRALWRGARFEPSTEP